MMSARLAVIALTIALFSSLTTGRMLRQGDISAQSERTAKAIVDGSEVMNAALANADARPARTKSLVYARLATRDTTEPWMEDGSTGARKLLQHETNSRSDRISQSLSAASDVIAKAVAAGSAPSATAAATNKAADYARLTTVESTEPWMFDTNTGARKLLQEHETNSRSDRISQSLSAASDVISKAVAAGSAPGATAAATDKAADFARLTTVDSTQPWQFDTTGARR